MLSLIYWRGLYFSLDFGAFPVRNNTVCWDDVSLFCRADEGMHFFGDLLRLMIAR
jgi:hypothetical protein